MGSAQLLQRCAPPRVLVVGGGPVGLSMGFLLDKVFNVPTRIVERQTQPTTHPQAHFLNLRTMEVLQATMPGFHDRLQAHAAPSELVSLRGTTGSSYGNGRALLTRWMELSVCTRSGATTSTARALARRASLRASTSSDRVRMSLYSYLHCCRVD